jgi:hypothetical protein
MLNQVQHDMDKEPGLENSQNLSLRAMKSTSFKDYPAN